MTLVRNKPVNKLIYKLVKINSNCTYSQIVKVLSIPARTNVFESRGGGTTSSKNS